MSSSWLFLDSHARGVLRLAVLPVTGRVRTRIIRRPRVNVPVALSAFLDVDALSRIMGVCVVAGPGSFSAVRGGVLTANLLARLLGVPLVGVSADEAEDLSALRARLVTGTIPAMPYVAPIYDAEPNITTPARAACLP